ASVAEGPATAGASWWRRPWSAPVAGSRLTRRGHEAVSSGGRPAVRLRRPPRPSRSGRSPGAGGSPPSSPLPGGAPPPAPASPGRARERCETGTLPRCSARAASHLALILGGSHAEVLPEWLALAAGLGRRVPPAMLPDLLEAGLQWPKARPELQSAIRRVIG